MKKNRNFSKFSKMSKNHIFFKKLTKKLKKLIFGQLFTACCEANAPTSINHTGLNLLISRTNIAHSIPESVRTPEVWIHFNFFDSGNNKPKRPINTESWLSQTKNKANSLNGVRDLTLNNFKTRMALIILTRIGMALNFSIFNRIDSYRGIGTLIKRIQSSFRTPAGLSSRKHQSLIMTEVWPKIHNG